MNARELHAQLQSPHPPRLIRWTGPKANPIGVAACALQSKLPGELKRKLPTVKQLADIVRAEMEGGK